MQQYKEMVQDVLKMGTVKSDRTGTGTISLFGYQKRFNLAEGFPLLTTKKVNFKAIVAELLWFLSGSTNINDLKKIHPTKIWDDWADKNGELGRIYGYQWRKWDNQPRQLEGHYLDFGIDQISNVIDNIKKNPTSRRLIVSAWNVADIDRMALPPCHCFFQFNVDGDFLDLQLYQRSADLALGVPFNIASYSLLLMIIANETKLKPRTFVHTFGDLHIYSNHIEGLKEQLTREEHELPAVKITNQPWKELTINDFILENYDPAPAIMFPIAV